MNTTEVGVHMSGTLHFLFCTNFLLYETSPSVYKVSHLKSSRISRSWRGLLSPVKNIALITRVLYAVAHHLLTTCYVPSTGITRWPRQGRCPQGLYDPERRQRDSSPEIQTEFLMGALEAFAD